jgi:excisionase family DNA binding protein
MEPILAAQKAALSVKEACRYAGISRSFLYTLFDERKLPRLKAGRRTLILKCDLDAYLAGIRVTTE